MKKNGFTLVELLAVIIILGVISLITVPIVTNVIEDSKKRSLESDCNEIYNAYDQYEISEDIGIYMYDCIIFDFEKNLKESEVSGTYIFEPIEKLNLKGEIPEIGSYKICNGKKNLAIQKGNYTCIKNDNKSGIFDGNIDDNDITEPIIDAIVATSTTNSISVIVSARDDESSIVKYYYRLDDGEVVNQTDNKKTFEGLSSNTPYKITIEVEDENGNTTSIIENVTTKNIDSPKIVQANAAIVSGYSYAKNRVIGISYSSTNIENPVYYFKSSVEATVPSGTVTGTCGTGTNPGKCTSSSVTTLVAGTWYVTTSTTPKITYTQNGTLYAITSDGINKSAESTYDVTEIDTSAPSASLEVDTESLKTDRATLTATCSDAESGITKYEFSKDNGSTWVSNGTTRKYTFTGLTQGTEYTYQVRCTNGSGMTKTASSTGSPLKITNPAIISRSRNQINGYDYAIYETVQIVYSSENIVNPEYYFKSSVEVGVSSGTVIASCGTGIVPEECTSSSVTSLVANTWYKTEKTPINFTYTQSGTLYALVSDGTNISGTSAYDITKVDGSSPSASLSAGEIKTDRITLTATCSDSESGITKYEFSKDNGTTWVDNGTTENYTFTELTHGTEYKFQVRCTNGSSITKTANSTATTSTIKSLIFDNATSDFNGTEYEWAEKRTITINYAHKNGIAGIKGDNSANADNIVSSEYYFKSSVSATTTAGTALYSCGTDTKPGECTKLDISATELEPNTWYKTGNPIPYISYIQEGTLYAIISDGTNTLEDKYDVTKVDGHVPSIWITFMDFTFANTSEISYSFQIYADDVGSGILRHSYSVTGVDSVNVGLKTDIIVKQTSVDDEHHLIATVTDYAGNISTTTLDIDNTITPKSIYIGQLYEKVLGRMPDLAGMWGWNEGVENAGDLAWAIFFSEEAKEKLSETDYEGIVKAAYMGILGRQEAPTGDELTSAINRIKDIGKEEYLKEIINSQEFINLCDKWGLTHSNGNWYPTEFES